MKLASYYTILDHIKKENEEPLKPGYSFASPRTLGVYSSESEFGKIVNEIDYIECMRVLDEMMETTRILVPKLYDAVMRKLAALR